MNILSVLQKLGLESGFAAFFITDGGWTLNCFSTQDYSLLQSARIPFPAYHISDAKDGTLWLSGMGSLEKAAVPIQAVDGDLLFLQQVHADVLTIGDSFSQRDEDAYQNYLCYKGLSVVNCERHMFYNPMTFAYEVMNLDIIDSTRVKVLVVEIVERYVENFMTHFEPNPQKSTLMTKRKKLKDKRPTRWSLERARSFLFLRTGYVENPVILEQLDADYFSSDKPQALYYYNEDLDGLSISKEKESAILANYQRLLDLAQEKHIKLIFMVAADKYDMYQGHIINNPNGKKTVNEDIAPPAGEQGLSPADD